MPCEEVLKSEIYVHDKGGLNYQVENIVPDLTGYEATHSLDNMAVIYSQLEDGEINQAGTIYVRAEEDFKQQFTLVEQ